MYKEILKKAYLSSDASPWSLGIFSGVGESLETHYVPHGILPYSENRIYFSTLYFNYEYNYKRLKNKTTGKCVKMFSKDKKPKMKLIKTNVPLRVGIIFPLLPNKKYIINLINQIKNNFDSVEIELKKHPNQIGGKNIDLTDVKDVDSLEYCDFVISGNSGHIIEMINQGIPVIYQEHIDNAPMDIYELAKEELIYSADLIMPIEINKINEFYSTSIWVEKWRQLF